MPAQIEEASQKVAKNPRLMRLVVEVRLENPELTLQEAVLKVAAEKRR